MYLHTQIPTCSLRPWQPDDRLSLAHHANNRNVWRNLTHTFPHPYTEVDAASWIKLANQASSCLHLAIELHGEAVGGIGVVPGEGIAARTAQFGYWLGEAHWGKGLATAAACTMISHARAAFTFARFEAPVFGWNPKSMRVLEKVGFVREGLLRHSVFKDGETIDSIMYALVTDA